MLLKDKVVVITGIGPGLGLKMALLAAQEGVAGLVLASRSADKLQAAADEIAQLDGAAGACKVLQVPTDIQKKADCENLVAKAVETFGRIDCLVNSAYQAGNVNISSEDADFAEWRKAYETNVVGTMQMTNTVVPVMKEQKSGTIVMINTMVTRKPFGGQAGYAASKGGLAAATKFLARDLGKYGIRVNTVAMGWMWGTSVEGYFKYVEKKHGVSMEDQIAKVTKNIPLGVIPTDEDCAKAALMMASDYTAVVTGAWLDCNGGEYIPQ